MLLDLLYELMHYWYHRAAHEWGWLWRPGHQMHHSAESLDAFGAYYLHPLDAALFTTWAVIAFFPVLGLAPEAGALASAFLALFGTFRNPAAETREAGFYPGASAKLGAMLAFRAVA